MESVQQDRDAQRKACVDDADHLLSAGSVEQQGCHIIYSEEKKTLVYAMQQIQSGGIARTGQGAAVLVVLMIVPIAIFIFSESQILETMASSGLKD